VNFAKECQAKVLWSNPHNGWVCPHASQGDQD
jgi:hypothetical protein